DQPRFVEALIVGEELEPTDFLVRPGVTPGDALQTSHVRQNFCPPFVITFQGGMHSPAAIEVERGRPRPGDYRFRTDRGRVLRSETQRMCSVDRENFNQQFATGNGIRPQRLWLRDVAVKR